jgi:hypothetical protein
VNQTGARWVNHHDPSSQPQQWEAGGEEGLS